MDTSKDFIRTLDHHPSARIQPSRSSTVTGNSTHTNLRPETINDSNMTTRKSSTIPPGSSRHHAQRQSAILPPHYDELFPPGSASASRRPARALPSPPDGMDPLVAAMWHNENLSLLHRLPDRVLLKIIAMLSNSGVECIRRVARKFPPLCVREVLSPLRGSRPRLSETGPLNWPRFGGSSHLRPLFLQLVDRDEYCDDCQAAWMSPRWEQRLRLLTEYIHCSACGADHPACLFSATQRIKPARMRYCIAHEGYMRICDHESGTIRLSRLLNPEHRHPWYQRKQKNDGPNILRCRHPSHDKSCSKEPGGSFPKSKRGCGSTSGFCHGIRWPEIRGSWTEPNRFAIFWTAHIPFNGQMDAMRTQLEEIRNNAGKYIVPREASATETPELRCFDPNDCHCMTYPGTENVRWEWECGPWLPGTTKCLSDPFRGLNALLPTRPSTSAVFDLAHRVVQSLKSKVAPKCMVEPKTHRSREQASPNKYGPGLSGVEVKPCHTGKDCLVVDYMRTLVVCDGGKILPYWYNALDPDSYNITDDEDGLGVFWCPQSHCRNYFKGPLNYAGVLRGLEFRKECRHYDCR